MSALFQKLKPHAAKVTLVFYLYWILCFVLTHAPIPADIPLEQGSDKVLHFLGYFVLASLFLLSMSFKRQGISLYLRVAMILLLYAGLDEWTQTFVGRDCDILDYLTDALAVATASATFFLVHRYQ